jgi:hypothetical protein
MLNWMWAKRPHQTKGQIYQGLAIKGRRVSLKKTIVSTKYSKSNRYGKK